MTKLTPQARTKKETPRTGRRRPVLAFLASGLLLLSLSLQAAEEPGWRLEEVLSIGGPKSDLLSMWVGVTVDAEGYIYVTDNVQCSLMKLDSQGKLVKKTGRRGRGPGEFLAPRKVDVSARAVFVVDNNIPSIEIYDRELKYQHRIPLSFPVEDIRAHGDSSLAVSCMPIRASDLGKIIILDYSGRQLRTVPFYPPQKKAVWAASNFIFSPGGELYSALIALDRIAKVDSQGKLAWAKSLFDPAEVKAKSKTIFGIPRTLAYKAIALDPQGRIFVLGGSYCRNPHRDVFVLSPDDGRLLATLTLPQSSHCLYLDQKGFLYCRADKGMTLKKFRIVVPAEKP